MCAILSMRNTRGSVFHRETRTCYYQPKYQNPGQSGGKQNTQLKIYKKQNEQERKEKKRKKNNKEKGRKNPLSLIANTMKINEGNHAWEGHTS